MRELPISRLLLVACEVALSHLEHDGDAKTANASAAQAFPHEAIADAQGPKAAFHPHA